MKLIFLDFDGVLNSFRSCLAFKGYPFPTPEETWSKFDLVAIGLIKRLCEETGAKIVVSSTWRLHMSIPQMIMMLNGREFPDAPIIGRTPDMGGSQRGYGEARYRRGDEISMWLTAFNRGDIAPALLYEQTLIGTPITDYVIVDDDSDMLATQNPYFVKTSLNAGLTLTNFLDMLRVLDPNHNLLQASVHIN